MNRVFITGVGCITPLGNNVETLWNNIKSGACGIDFIKKIDVTDLPVKIAAEVKDFHPEDYGIDKTMIRHNDTFALFALYFERSSCLFSCQLEERYSQSDFSGRSRSRERIGYS